MISVIVPTCNRNDLLSKCLNKLDPSVQGISRDVYEVIVTDDSRDDSAKVLITESYNWVKWVAGKKKGPAANRNNGVANAHGDWLVFVDDDCMPDEGLLNAYMEGIKNFKKIKVFEGYINVNRVQQNFLEEAPINTTGGFLWSCNFMIEKDFFVNVLKGFDEEYPYASMEDVDLHYRIQHLNQPIQFLTGARVVHPWRIQQKPFDVGKKRFSSIEYFMKKFPEKKKYFNSKYFLRAFLRSGYGIFKNSFHYKFRGFIKGFASTFLQLYFAFKVMRNNF